jgi:transcriptional regulator with XRE-family HTH domain
MNSLPPVIDPTFREKLREAREARGLSQYALAKLAGIAGVMPKRYEDASDRYATLPNAGTWNKLNAVLFPTDQEQAAGSRGDPRAANDVQPRGSLAEAAIEEIVAELKRRGASSVVINW